MPLNGNKKCYKKQTTRHFKQMTKTKIIKLNAVKELETGTLLQYKGERGIRQRLSALITLLEQDEL